MEGPEGTNTGARRAPERFPFTKFLPPALDDRVVTEHLVARLDAAIGPRPLTVLVAPAGSGKTTALAAWAAASSSDLVWVRLDTDDDGPSALASALLEAGRRRLGDAFGGRLAQLLAYAGATATGRQLVTSLVNDLGDLGPVTLLLDDVHTVSDPTTWAMLDDLLDHLPPDVRVVLGSRVEPAVSLPRRRVRGEVAELGLEELRLDREAIRRVLSHDAAVTDEQIDAVLGASGGWAAAVRLATAHGSAGATRVVDRPPRVVTDVLGDLRHFLVDEVLESVPEPLRTFLLETSVLDELTPATCDAVTGRDDSLWILGELDRRNLFVTRHRDGSEDSWRTHDLFGAFLREQLTSRYDAPAIAELHRRAADHLPPLRAVQHLLAAGDHARAAELIIDLGMSNLDASLVLRLAPAIRGLSREVRDGDHRLTLLLTFATQVTGDAQAAVAELEPLRDRLLSSGEDAAAAEVNGSLVDSYLQLGELDAAGAALEQALSHVGPPWHRPSTLTVGTWWYYYQGDWAGVSRSNEEAIELALSSGDPNLYKVVAPGLSPLLLFVDRGPAWLAAAVDRLVAGLSEDDMATLTALRPVRAAAALLDLDVTEAAVELRRCLVESTGYGGMAWKHQEAEVMLLSVCLATGDLAAVQRLVEDALPRLGEPMYRQYRYAYVHAALRAHWLAGEHRELVTTYGRLVTAEPDGQFGETVVRCVAEGMLARIEGRTEDALRVLQKGEEAQHAGRCWLWAGMPGLDRASILLEQGRAAAAIEAALPTLEVAARTGPGLLLPEARANRDVLERCLGAGVHTDVLRAVLSASQPADRSPEPVAIPGTDETLSGRELEVLTQVASGASNREIAGSLFITEPTVKSHMTRILRKLGASSRTHAVARARAMRLL